MGQDHVLTIGDYWTILMRRKRQFMVPFILVVILGSALAFMLPSMFRSEATIMIERQSIPEELVATTVTGYVQEQIQQIRQKINSYENLLAIAREHHLYPEIIESNPGEVATRISENIEVEMEEVQATDPNRAGERRATIAFTVAYSDPKPLTAQIVTNDLASRYLAEHRATREDQAREVSEFLELESQKLRAEIAELEGAMAEFKQDKLHRLPELMDMNLRLFEKTEAEIAETEVRIRETRDKIEALQSELSLTPAYQDVETETGEVLLTAEKQLSSLTAQYLRASARYSSRHPDVIKLAREIRMFAEQTGQAARTDEMLSELAVMQERLRTLRRQYSDAHPEVRSVEQSIAAMQRGLQTVVLGNEQRRSTIAPPPDNPRYVSLQTQIKAAESNLDAEVAKLSTLQKKQAEYEERLYSTPGVERDFKTLTLDYQNANAKYQELKGKQQEARLAQELEAGGSAEQFILLSAAFLPSAPDSPNRLGIILLSVVFAFAVGLVAVAVAEYSDHTIRGVRSLENALGFAPLTTIPNGARSRLMMNKVNVNIS